MSVKPYVSIFSESKKKDKKQILESAQKTIAGVKRKIKKFREEDETPSDVVDSIETVADALDDVIGIAIDELGAADASFIVDDLTSAAQSLDMQADVVEEEDEIFESKKKLKR